MEQHRAEIGTTEYLHGRMVPHFVALVDMVIEPVMVLVVADSR